MAGVCGAAACVAGSRGSGPPDGAAAVNEHAASLRRRSPTRASIERRMQASTFGSSPRFSPSCCSARPKARSASIRVCLYVRGAA